METEGMRTCYVDTEHRAIADLVAPNELTSYWTITRINVPHEHRGKGLGTKLLRRILEDADKAFVILALEPSPSDGLNYDQLTAWYSRHGFELTQSGYMLRSPRCQFEWRDGWGEHRCSRSGAHDEHLCRCDQRKRVKSSVKT